MKSRIGVDGMPTNWKRIGIATDHGGFDLKEHLVGRLARPAMR